MRVSLENVSVSYGAEPVLEGVTLALAAGEVLAILGASGSGKSSLLRVVMGFVPPTGGRVLLGGELVSDAGRVLRPPEERNLAVVFQDLALWPHLDVQGNLAFGLRAKGVARDDARRRSDDMLARVGLGGMQRRSVGELSGGERQRVAIARALVLEPDVVLLDEPLSNVDIRLQDELLELFAALFGERESSVLHVSHDPVTARRLASRVAILDQGHLAYLGEFSAIDPEHESPFVRLVGRLVQASG
ncbi:MAG: ATP-binding cassette domain-containing protein [Deltaproteobacteria bacterium]|nr:ATP-binding cassette domain-containing protein [Deltaproteobacteria bacterium]